VKDDSTKRGNSFLGHFVYVHYNLALIFRNILGVIVTSILGDEHDVKSDISRKLLFSGS
jgi:hypothetical protein